MTVDDAREARLTLRFGAKESFREADRTLREGSRVWKDAGLAEERYREAKVCYLDGSQGDVWRVLSTGLLAGWPVATLSRHPIFATRFGPSCGFIQLCLDSSKSSQGGTEIVVPANLTQGVLFGVRGVSKATQSKHTTKRVGGLHEIIMATQK